MKARGSFVLWAVTGLMFAVGPVALFSGGLFSSNTAPDTAPAPAASTVSDVVQEDASSSSGDVAASNVSVDGNADDEMVGSSLNALFAALNEAGGRVQDESVLGKATDVTARAGSFFSRSGRVDVSAQDFASEIDEARSAVISENALWKADPSNAYSGHVDYTINVTGFCDESDCAQRAVDGNVFAFISWGPDFSQIAGSNEGHGKVIASFRDGDIVRVTGRGEGVYQVDRILNVPVRTSASDVDSGFAFQTTTKDGTRLAYAHRID